MQKSLIAALTLVLLIVIFALQNADIVTITIYFWEFTSYISLIMILMLFLGVVMGVLFSWPSIRKRNSRINELTKKQNENDTETKY